MSDEPYVGVSPEYRNYANDTEKPYQSPEGAERKIEVQVARAEERNQVEFNDFGLPNAAPVEFSSGSADPDADLDEDDDKAEDKAEGKAEGKAAESKPEGKPAAKKAAPSKSAEPEVF